MRSPDYIEGFVDALKFVVKSFEEVKVNSPTEQTGLDTIPVHSSKEENSAPADTREEQIKSESRRDKEQKGFQRDWVMEEEQELRRYTER